jgi:transcriptional regulator with PAS, ATPase and Fis domain
LGSDSAQNATLTDGQADGHGTHSLMRTETGSAVANLNGSAESAAIERALLEAGLCPVNLQALENAAIRNALRHAAGNRTYAAKSLGISVRTLQRKLRAWSGDGEA